jgi:hypothetical protein
MTTAVKLNIFVKAAAWLANKAIGRLVKRIRERRLRRRVYRLGSKVDALAAELTELHQTRLRARRRADKFGRAV